MISLFVAEALTVCSWRQRLRLCHPVLMKFYAATQPLAQHSATQCQHSANAVPVVLCHLALMKFYAATLKCIIHRSNIQGENLRRTRVFLLVSDPRASIWILAKAYTNERIDQSKQKFAIVLKKNQMCGNLKVLDLSWIITNSWVWSFVTKKSKRFLCPS